MEEKKGKETSLKENRGKDFFLEKKGEGANSFLLEKAKKFFQKKRELRSFYELKIPKTPGKVSCKF